jgi:HlyD family secretion protein
MRMKKTILAIAAVLVVALVLLGLLRGWRARRAASGLQYETVAVRLDTIVATVNTSGSVSPKQQVNMTFSSAGLLERLLVEPGQTVRAGDELAGLDTRQLELGVTQAEATLQINEARLAQTRAGSSEADIASAEAAVASAEASYDSARKKLNLRSDQLTVAEIDLKRAELALRDAQAAYDLVAWRPEIGMLPQSGALQRATLDYQRAQANYNLQVAAIDDAAFKGAAAQVAQAKAQLDRLNKAPVSEELAIAEAQVKQAQAALEQAELRVADATLVAPFDGTVLATSGRAGELVGSAVPVVVLADLGSYYVDTSIDETDIGLVQVGQDVAITIDAFPDATLRGKVVRVEPLGKVTQGVVSYDMRVEVLSQEVLLRPNMTAMVDVVIDRKEGILVVPNRAIKRDTRGRRYVEILTDGKVEERTVTVGLSNELVTEISQGLVEGEEVVVNAPRQNVLSQFGQPFQLGSSRQ